MKYRITITQLPAADSTLPATIGELEVFRQVIDDLNISSVITALNQKPRGRRPNAAKKEVAM